MDKLGLMKITFGKLSLDKAYVAYHLNNYMQKEEINAEQLQKLLGCSSENFYKLALCAAPDLSAPDLELRIQKISSYCGVAEFMLFNLLAGNEISTKAQPTAQLSYLRECIQLLKKIIAGPKSIYQSAFTILLLFLLVYPSSSRSDTPKKLSVFMADYIQYSDSVKHLALGDNTCFKNKIF